MTRAIQPSFFDELIIDNFAGGGGASTGIELALGRAVDIAINHDAEAVLMHTANHPYTTHYCEDVWSIDPAAACQGRSVGLAWFSPDCKHFSKAKGGQPVSRHIRGLAWVVIRWAQKVRLGLIHVVSTRPEPLCAITKKECVREGFPEMEPADFVAMLCRHYRCDPGKTINRIEFVYLYHVVSTRPEPLCAITKKECVREGFPEMEPADFVAMLCRHYRCDPGKTINRIEFVYLYHVVSTRPEPLCAITKKECVREGFPEMEPADFVAMLCRHYRCDPGKTINRIEFVYL